MPSMQCVLSREHRNRCRSNTMTTTPKIIGPLVCLLTVFSGCFSQDRIRNIAFKKTCEMESTYHVSHRADFAVNNNTDGNYDRKPPNCIHTGKDKRNTWWKVNLGRPYPVQSITVWARDGFLERMSRCIITVDGNICYNFISIPRSNPINVNCSSGVMNGSVVQISKNSASGIEEYYINFCEFQVWSCSDPYWGIHCDRKCGHCSGDHVCDKINGNCTCEPGFKPPLCTEECNKGTFGQNCSHPCHVNCAEGDCHKTSGNCICLPGWKPPMCDHECDQGTHGYNCSQNCSQNCNGACNTATGQCTCLSGWKPAMCDQVCDNGTYGQNCSTPCGHCEDDQACNNVNGQCPSCAPGWKPPLCQECDGGTYGPGCNKICGQGCNNSLCHRDTGVCSCTIGWQSPLCNEELPHTGNDASGIIVPVVIVGLAIVVVAIIVIIVLRRRRIENKTSPTTLNRNSANVGQSGISFSNYNITENEIERSVPAVKPSASRNTVTRAPANETNIYSNVSDSKKIKPNPFFEKDYRQTDKRSKDVDVSVDVDDEDDAAVLEGVYLNESIYSNANEYDKAWDSIQIRLLTKLNAGNFDKEFEALPLGFRKAHNAGLAEENFNKNRFMSILPYDITRVVLQGPYDADNNDYINASYIRGCRSAKDYIAAQGPKRRTVNDFWKMIWQEHVTHIVMLTKLVEGEKNKCEEYWPKVGSKISYGCVHVTGKGEQSRADFIIRTFDVRVNGSDVTRNVTHYLYTSWLDHSIPTPMSLVDFWRTVRTSHRNQQHPSPLLVHCSAGVGRTGTYIALDIALDHAEQRTKIDIPAIVGRIREDRCNMIQAKSQYIFLYEAVLEAYTSRLARYDASTFDCVFAHDIDPHKENETIDAEFEMLQSMKGIFYKPNFSEATKEENINKNRCSDVLPDNKHLVYLTVAVPGRNQYINAVFMSTFRQRMGRILTQLPVPNTVLDLWRLVNGNDITVIVCLDPHSQIERSSRYWPLADGETMSVKPYSVTLNSKEDLNRHIRCYTLSLKHEEKIKSCEISLLHFLNWMDEIPANTSQLLHLIDTMTSLQADKLECRVLVQCFDGASKSGLFSAACDVISRMTCDHEVDVYMAVRHVHNVRPQSVTSLVQYRYLYRVVQEFKKQMDVYANA